jgi:3-oxoacyl-[acyl-carrier protein] reductase
MDLGLSERAAVVLASTSGLGFATARALLAEGARVAVSGRDPARLERALARLAEGEDGADRAHRTGRTGRADRIWGEPLDVTDGAALARHVEAAARRFGRPVQVLVTNAGGPPPASALDVTDAELERAYRLTLRSAIHAIHAALPGMRASGWGRIVALTSSSVRVPIPALVYSNVMRSGLTAYLKSLASEVAKDGVLVNSVNTGSFATERLAELFEAQARRSGRTVEEERAAHVQRIPLGRLGEPDELGALVAFLCSERCSFLSGVALAYDGGANPALL